MGVTREYSDGKQLSSLDTETRIMPKDEAREIDAPSETMYSDFKGNLASSSGSSIRSSFLEMGFSQSLVDKVIDENGEDNVDLLLENLFTYSTLQKTKSHSSDSLDELFSGIKTESIPSEFEAESHPKEEPCFYNNANDDRRASLLSMKFSVAEIDFALGKLGEDASVGDLVDFIAAAQIAGNLSNDLDDRLHADGEQYKVDNTEALYGTMNTTLRLLEMGFSENEISLAIDKFGSEVPISELAEYIFRQQRLDACGEDDKSLISMKLHHLRSETDYGSIGTAVAGTPKRRFDTPPLKSTEQRTVSNVPPSSSYSEKKIQKGKKPKQEGTPTHNNPTTIWNEDLKPHRITSSAPWLNDYDDDHTSEITKLPIPAVPAKTAAKPPYFFYGSVVNVPPGTWAKISQFLYGVQPECTNAGLYSALKRTERYVHNLPTENRFRFLPEPAMNIPDAIPEHCGWWPEWDTRRKLNAVSHETAGISQACARVGRMLLEGRRNEVLLECWRYNLVWCGAQEVAPLSPEQLERVLGYPSRHSLDGTGGLEQRLHSLRWCFQTNTLGFHLSGLVPLFPEGVAVLSLFSGIGGAEVSLHRLGVRLRCVVSVEGCEGKRGILRRWWGETGQTGELVQIDDIQKVGSTRLEGFVKRFGGFDFVICQNQCGFLAGRAAADGAEPFDFSMFVEFVRVLKVVKTIMERRIS